MAYVSVFDKEITITYNSDLTFCYNPGQCGGPFSGFGFYFSNGVDITKVTASGSSSFQPIPGGLSWSPTTILVNLNGDAPAMNDELDLNVYFAGGGPSTSEPSTRAMMLLGFAGVGFAGWRRMAKRTT